MSEDGRRVFAMETALGVIGSQGGKDVLELVSFALSRPVCECCLPAVAPIVKGWLYSLNPAFMEKPYDTDINYDLWMNEQKTRLGDNVSMPCMPAAEVTGIHAMLDTVEKAMQTAEAKEEEAEAANAAVGSAQADIKALTPFKAKTEELEKKIAQLEEKNKALAADLSAAKEEAAAFNGKVAINENEIEKAVKDIITKAVGSMSFAAGSAPAGADSAGGEPESAPAADVGGNTDSAGAVPDSFGFGTSGPSDDGFGF